MTHAVLLFRSADRKGIVYKISEILYQHDCNIEHADQHRDINEQFFFRVAFSVNQNKIDFTALEMDLRNAIQGFHGVYQLHDMRKRLKMGILVSKQGHCLSDLLHRWESGDLEVDIPFVISNHLTHERLVKHYGLPYYHIAASPSDRKEKEILDLVCAQSDFLVLARYMQILSGDFITQYNKDIINIHHSFLPSFKGGNPYKQAFERGVKIIGATAHFVSENLDEGPIIDQEIARISHKDTVETMKRKGQSLEQTALAHTVHHYIDHRILRYGRKTIVF